MMLLRNYSSFLVVVALSLVSCLASPALFAEEKSQNEADATSDAAAENEPPPLNIPIQVGHEVKGIKVPYFSFQGVKQMEFFAAVAKRVDEARIQLDDVRVETFKEDGTSDMVVTLPKSVFFVATQNIVGDTGVTIQRSDFRIRGEKVDFDTRSRKGKFFGKVNMRIYNKDEMFAPKASKK